MKPDPVRKKVEEKAEAARDALSWVSRRLDVLEYLILFLALVLAMVGGALVAWILSSSMELPFRMVWAVSSLLLFILPGGFVYLREFRKRGESPPSSPESKPKDPNG